MTTTATANSWLDSIPGARNALNYVLGQVAAFQGIPNRLQNVNAWLNRIIATVGGPNAAQAQALISALQSVQSQYSTTAAALGELLPQLQGAGLLGLDLGMLANMVTVAANVEDVLSSTQEIEKETNTLATGAGVGQPNIGGGGFNWKQYLLWGGLLYAGYYGIKRARGSRRY